MPITPSDIDAEIARRNGLAAIDEAIERRTRDQWPQFRGAAAQLQALFDTETRPTELMISGPAETGKTMAACWMIDRFARAFPGAQITIGRKLRSTMDGTVLNTWRRVIAIRGGVQVYGGEKPEWYDYHNGSRVWVAGLDNPGKALSSERDLIYINQAEDLRLDDWQTLTTRTTGRGSVAPWTLLLGDCNPGAPSHWIMQRATLRRLESRHEDNPSLYTEAGVLTPQGVRTMAVLDALVGVLYERLRLGRWVVAEGAVYAFDRALHLIDAMPPGWLTWRKFRAIDFGFTNPFVCLWGAVDGDGRLYIYRQIYMTERTVDIHAKTIQKAERWYLEDEATGEWIMENGRPVPNPAREKIEATVADHDAEDRATLANHRIITLPAKKDVSPGIQAMQRRLRVAGDGRPRFYLLNDSLIERDDQLAAKHLPTSMAEEFDAYAWPKGADGKPNKEAPVKLYDHAMDPGRYLVTHLERASRGLIR